MHTGWRPYLVGSAVHCEDKDEDDDEKEDAGDEKNEDK